MGLLGRTASIQQSILSNPTITENRTTEHLVDNPLRFRLNDILVLKSLKCQRPSFYLPTYLSNYLGTYVQIHIFFNFIYNRNVLNIHTYLSIDIHVKLEV